MKLLRTISVTYLSKHSRFVGFKKVDCNLITLLHVATLYLWFHLELKYAINRMWCYFISCFGTITN